MLFYVWNIRYAVSCIVFLTCRCSKDSLSIAIDIYVIEGWTCLFTVTTVRSKLVIGIMVELLLRMLLKLLVVYHVVLLLTGIYVIWVVISITRYICRSGSSMIVTLKMLFFIFRRSIILVATGFHFILR